MKNYLEFEKEIKTLEDEMELLKSPGNESISEVDTSRIKTTQDQINSKLKSIYSNLNRVYLDHVFASLSYVPRHKMDQCHRIFLNL